MIEGMKMEERDTARVILPIDSDNYMSNVLNQKVLVIKNLFNLQFHFFQILLIDIWLIGTSYTRDLGSLSLFSISSFL